MAEAENLTRLCAEFAGCATPAVRIKTVTASCVFNLQPNHPKLEEIKDQWPNHASLEPEIFNGLVLHCEGSVKLLVFHSWRCIIAGARSVDDATDAIAMLCNIAKLNCAITWSASSKCTGFFLSSES
jgi:TATA-box binding protein (TBP) (component of TFIID and TFIIIB)